MEMATVAAGQAENLADMGRRLPEIQYLTGLLERHGPQDHDGLVACAALITNVGRLFGDRLSMGLKPKQMVSLTKFLETADDGIRQNELKKLATVDAHMHHIITQLVGKMIKRRLAPDGGLLIASSVSVLVRFGPMLAR
ncbi:hypothetical protein ACFL26_01530 [Patescibacteria group bacterium]